MPSQAVLELLVNLKDNASSGLSSLSSAVGSLGMAAGGVALAGVAALGAAVVSGIGDAREAAQIYAQTQAVIASTGGAAGVTADQVSDLAASLSAASGKSLFGDDAIQQSTNLLLTFTELKGGVLDAATAISVDMAQAMGGAPKDAAIQLGKALNDPIAGISALSRVGVAFTDEQKEQIKTMQEAGDMAGAQSIILAELNKEFGGSAQAAADADGGWAQFNDRMGEAKETLGAALLPVLSQLATILTDTVMPVIEDTAAIVANFVDSGGDLNILAEDLLEVFGIDIYPFVDAIKAASAIVTDVFTGDMPDALTSTGDTFTVLQDVINTVMSAIQGVVGAVLPVIAAFWEENGDSIMAFVKTTWDTIQSIIQIALQIIQAIVVPILSFIAGFIKDHGTQIQALLKAAWDAISGVISTVLGLIQGVLQTVLLAIQGDWSGAWEMLKKTSADFVQGILDTITTVLGDLEGVFNDVIASIQKAWDDAVAGAASIGRDIINGIINGVNAAASALYNTLSGMASDALKAAQDALGIESPSALFAEGVGVPIIEGIVLGIRDAMPSLLDEIGDVEKDLYKQAEKIGASLNDALASGFAATGSFDRTLAKNMDAILKVSDSARAGVQKALDAAASTAAQISDPKSGADYLKMRSAQIFELANLQDTLGQATSDKERARIQQQIQLITAAQAAEQNAFATNERGAGNPLATQLQQLLAGLGPNSPLGAQLQGMLGQAQRGGFATPAFAPSPVGAAADGGRGGQTVINNTFNLPPGTPAQIADEVIRRLSSTIAGRR